MPLQLPRIDDRSYQQILNEALARIPVHNPEWTNFNDSDPGVTLIQLFAFMTESLLYRSNLIPERNRRKFLQLLGIALQPAASAQGLIALSAPSGPPRAITLAGGEEVFAGAVPFRTQDGLDVLPIEARVYYKRTLQDSDVADLKPLYDELYADLQTGDARLAWYETLPLVPPAAGYTFPEVNLGTETVDGALWVAVLARKANELDAAREAIGGRWLSLGVLPSLTNASRVLEPGSTGSADAPDLIYELPNLTQLEDGKLPPEREKRVASWRAISEARPTGDLTAYPGIVQLQLPAAKDLILWSNLEPREEGSGEFPPLLEDPELSSRVITWLRVRLRKPDEAAASAPNARLDVRLSWLGINAARVTQRARVPVEIPGTGTGEPDQLFTLVNKPVLLDGIQVLVNGEVWARTDDLSAAPPEVPVRNPRLPPGAAVPQNLVQDARVYTLDRESGELRFGDGLHGMRPPRGAIIQVRYEYGGGKGGNVGIGAISRGALPGGIKVSNPLPTWGGDDAETVVAAEKRIPLMLQHRDRAVSSTDFDAIARQTPGIQIGRLEVLGLYHPLLGEAQAEGVVTLLVVPAEDPASPDAPSPDRLFLDALCRYLEPRRLITTELHVRGPVYVPIWLSVGFEVMPGRDIPPVREAIKTALKTFLSPLVGGFDQRGWPLRKAVEALELWAVATRVEGVSKVVQVLLGTGSGGALDRIPMSGLELPQILSVAAQTGAPQSLEEMRGETSSDPAAPLVVPVPIIPLEC